MKLSFSKIYNPSKKTILKYHFFDPVIFRDSRYYIDPILIPKSSSKIIASSYQDLLEYYRKLLVPLKKVSREDKSDTFWRASVSLFTFKEISAFHLGYGLTNRGTGLTSKLAERILSTSRDIIEAGYDDPEIFSIVGFLEEGIGADRISDMVGNILLDTFVQFTQKIVSECPNKRLKTFRIQGRSFDLPYNPDNDEPIILLPKDILKRLPEASDKTDIADIVNHNEDLRSRVNKIVGNEWSKVAKADLKKAVKDEIVKTPDIIEELIRKLKNTRVSYNFDLDPKNEESYRSAIAEFLEQFDLGIQRESSFKAAGRVLTYFREQIENNALWKNLYDDQGKALKETHAQKIFHALSLVALEESEIDVTPEANAGPGPVDFKYSRGSKDITLIEFKLSSNPKLIPGLARQLAAYMQAEKSKHGFYVVIVVDGHDKKIAQLRKKYKEMKRTDINLVVVEGRKKNSASKL